MLISQPITKSDFTLIEIAKSIAYTNRLNTHAHNVACVILTDDGSIVTGTNIKGVAVREVGVCAEPIALAELEEAHKKALVIVTVYVPHPTDPNQSMRVISPCGSCRELLCDYAPYAHVLCIDDDNVLKKVPVGVLLPARFRRS